MEFQEVVRRRRMVRNYEDRPLPPGVLDRILANAVRAPSAGFSQGWAFLALEGREQTESFWAATFAGRARESFRWPGLFRAPAVIVAFSHSQAYLDRYDEPDKRRRSGSGEDDGWSVPYWDIDTGFAALLMLLTAVDLHLGALFFAIPAGRTAALRRAFGVPDSYAPIGAITVGHPAPDEPSSSLARGHRPLEEVIHRGRW